MRKRLYRSYRQFIKAVPFYSFYVRKARWIKREIRIDKRRDTLDWGGGKKINFSVLTKELDTKQHCKAAPIYEATQLNQTSASSDITVSELKTSIVDGHIVHAVRDCIDQNVKELLNMYLRGRTLFGIGHTEIDLLGKELHLKLA